MNYKRLFIENSFVFITVVTNDRNKILIKNIELLRKSFKNAKKYYNFDIIAVVIMPDHFHAIIKPENIKDYPKIITAIKFYFSRNFNVVGQECPTYGEFQNQNNHPGTTYKRNKNIWQKRYYEHTIRDEKDLNNHLNYIHYNPIKHELVTCVKDWEYSSFHRFVEEKNYDIDWGSYKDIENIKALDYE